MTGLYVHIPFCVKKCAYCDFYSVTGRPPELTESYTQALLSEADRYRDLKCDTLYIGGGTPSLLGTKYLPDLLRGLYRTFDLSNVSETTVEVNPESASLDFLRTAKSKGVDRLSIGIQSMVDSELASVGRIHSAAQAKSVLMEARMAGFKSISADLIIGLPGQGWNSLVFSLQTILNMDINHLSLYCLTVEPGTPLAAAPQPDLPSDERQAELFEKASELLAAAGFIHYEISNFTRPGHECKHNLNYWRGGEYVGLGPSSASHLNGKRFKNKADVELYLNNPKGAVEETEKLPPERKAAEEAMLRLRLISEGLNFDDLKSKFGETQTASLAERLQRLAESGRLIKVGSIYRLPDDKVLVSNPILAEVVE